MRGLSLVGLLVGLGIVGMLMVKQLKSPPDTGNSPPTEVIERANEAVTIMEQPNDAIQSLEQQADQIQPEGLNQP